jgi:hypothetical protein
LIDFGVVEIGGAKIKAFVFMATLGYSRRLHARAFRGEKQEHWFVELESARCAGGGSDGQIRVGCWCATKRKAGRFRSTTS